MKHYIVKFSLRNKLLLGFLITGIIPALILGFLLYSFHIDNTVSSIQNSFNTALSQSSIILEESVSSIASSSTSIDDAQEKLEQLPYIKKVEKTPIYNGVTFEINVLNKTLYILLDTVYLENTFASQFDKNSHVNIVKLNENSDEYLNRISKENEINYIVAGATIFSKDIVVAQLINRNSVLKDAIFWGDISIRIGLIMMVASITLACCLSYKMSYGIDNLLDEIKRVHKGDFSDTPTYNSNDEIGLLSDTFHKMTAELDTLINKTFRLKISEREAHIKILQSQISPHFLYNALDSINWNLIEKEDYETSEILVALSSMLRYSIDYKKNIVTLNEEFMQVENYLKIQKSRFDDRFDYTIDLDKSIKSILVPKMILQPIVENAISHGLEDCQNGKLTISAKINSNFLFITIHDTGKGIPPKKLQNLLELINQKEQINDSDDFHIGLANVNHRLKYIHGKNSGVNIESIENEFTRITLKIELGDESNDYINS